METTAITGHVIPLYHECFDGESRDVQAMLDLGGYLLVGEKVEGALSAATFGSVSHYHQLVIAPESLGPLASMCGLSAHDARPEELIQALQHFFVSTGAFLSELMDELDAANIPYGYLPSVEATVASYRPARREDGSSY